jgi:hypothetical protein
MRDAVLPLPYQQGGTTTGQFPPSDILSPLSPLQKLIAENAESAEIFLILLCVLCGLCDKEPFLQWSHPSNPVVNGIGLAVTGEELFRRQARPGSPFLRIGGFADQQDDPNNLIYRQDCRKGIRQYESSIWGYPDRKFVCFHPAFGHIRATQERAAGIEPATAAWKAAAIPFCNARVRHSAALRGSLPACAASLRFVAGYHQSGRPDLNRRPLRPKRSALPSAPRPGSIISIPLFPRPVKVKVHRL